jgi:hypothetical protein
MSNDPKKPCDLHGVRDCPICFKHDGECDYGSCTNTATTTVPCYNDKGRIVENRPACPKHAKYGAGQGVGYDMRKTKAGGFFGKK